MPVKPLKSLSPRHHEAIRLRLEGKKNKDIAEALNMSQRVLEQWWCDELVKAEIETMVARIDDRFAEKMAQAGMVAIEELMHVAQMPTEKARITPSQKVHAAESILDRVPALARVIDRAAASQAEHGVGGPQQVPQLVQVIANMPDEKLAAFLAQWKGEAEGDVTGHPDGTETAVIDA